MENLVSDKELLEKAIAFELFPYDKTHRRVTYRDVIVEMLSQIIIQNRGRDPEAWVVVMSSFVLSKSQNEFVYDPSPSNRTDEDLIDTRFSSAQEAFSFGRKFLENYTVKYRTETGYSNSP
jgi:hypothetical protein